MAFLKRVFSSDYRRALAAEAAGEYLEAARAYALSGERIMVAEMHLLSAERLGPFERRGDGRLAALRTAVRWADGDSQEARGLRRRIARAMLRQVGRSGPISDGDRAILLEAAALFEGAGEPAGAGECLELAGDENAAAEAYQRAGDLERMEAVLAREEHRRRSLARRRELFEECQIHLAAGDRDLALEALRECVTLDPGGPAARLIRTLESRRIGEGRAALRGRPGGERTVYVGAFPFALGREPSCQVVLREGNVSRRHAEIDHRDGRFVVRDARSRNGTTLGGVRIEDELSLPERGELGLGANCTLSFTASPAVLVLRGVGGLDRELHVVASIGPIPLDGGAAVLRFDRGRPTLEAGPGRALRLQGARTGSRVQLIHGDTLEVMAPDGSPEARWEVE